MEKTGSVDLDFKKWEEGKMERILQRLEQIREYCCRIGVMDLELDHLIKCLRGDIIAKGRDIEILRGLLENSDIPMIEDNIDYGGFE